MERQKAEMSNADFGFLMAGRTQDLLLDFLSRVQRELVEAVVEEVEGMKMFSRCDYHKSGEDDDALVSICDFCKLRRAHNAALSTIKEKLQAAITSK